MPEPSPPAKLQVFLCHSSGDKEQVRALYQRLSSEEWIYPWLDEEELIPDQDWREEIEKAVEQSHVILVCLSPAAITKEGYVQREIRVALEYADYMPEGTIYIIPLKLQLCELPRRLSRWQWANYYEERGPERLMRALRLRADKLGIKMMSPKPPQPSNSSSLPEIVQPIQEESQSIAVQAKVRKTGRGGQRKSSLLSSRMVAQPNAPEIEQARLLLELENPATSHERRRDIGNQLNKIGDPRPGTGVIKANINGRKLELPDIAWCDIPAPPSGKVWLGANGWQNNPRHQVEFKDGFRMAKYLITYGQFQTFVDIGAYAESRWWYGFPQEYQPQKLNQSFRKPDIYPRDTISWYQGIAFTRWLTESFRALGQLAPTEEIRLPTEWEWEYAARGLDERHFPWGKWQESNLNTDQANLIQAVTTGMYVEGVSPFGVIDMSEQLLEWCMDKYDSNSNTRVVRGGLFNTTPDFTAYAIRLQYNPYFDSRSFGLRVVMAVSASLEFLKKDLTPQKTHGKSM